MTEYKLNRIISQKEINRTKFFLKHFSVLFYSLFFFLVTFQHLYSQTPPYYHYTNSDGLASSTVFDMLQDKEGFMWFGTLNGLNRFDGKHFITFNEKDGLNSPVITALLPGENGEIFISNYEKGINVLRNGKIENFRKKVSGKNFNSSNLIRHNGKIYTFTMYGKISVLNENTETNGEGFIPVPISLIIYRLTQQANNNLIVLTSKGIYKIINGKLIKLNIKGLPDKDYYSYAERSDGYSFIGGKGTIYQVKNNSVVNKIEFPLYSNKIFYSSFCDKKNNIWVSVLGKGFFIISYEDNKIVYLGKKMGLESTLELNKLNKIKRKTTFQKAFRLLKSV